MCPPTALATTLQPVAARSICEVELWAGPAPVRDQQLQIPSRPRCPSAPAPAAPVSTFSSETKDYWRREHSLPISENKIRKIVSCPEQQTVTCHITCQSDSWAPVNSLRCYRLRMAGIPSSEAQRLSREISAEKYLLLVKLLDFKPSHDLKMARTLVRRCKGTKI